MNGHPLEAMLRLLNARLDKPVLSIGTAGSEWARIADLGEPGNGLLDEMLASQSAFAEGLGAKGEAAYLIGRYSRLLALAVVPSLLIAGVLPDFAPDRLAIRLEPYALEFEGRNVIAKRVHLRFLNSSFQTDDANLAKAGGCHVAGREALTARLREGLEAHFAPLIERVRAATRLAATAQWRLIGDSFGAVFLEAGQEAGRPEQAKEEAIAVLKHPGSPLKNAQMHFFDLELSAPPAAPLRRTFRARGGCCRFYTAKGGRLCSTCVLRDPASRDAMLLDAMRGSAGAEA